MLRIVFLGASTVNGFPYATEISFPRRVEHLLEAQRPGTDVEVLNAAVTAINSFEIADLARQCLACEPDLVVIHTGHNEFFGPGGPASTELQLSPGWIDIVFAVRRWRLSQCLAALVPAGAPSSEHPLQSLPRLTDVRWGDATFEQAATNLRVNLRRTLDTLRGAGVPVVLSTVACNLRDQGPIRTVWPEAVTPEQQQRCQALIAEAEQLAALQQPEAALGRLREAESIAREVAHLQFRIGQALEALGRRDEAREAFALARDFDGCRFRAPSLFGEIVREIAAEHDEDVTLLDVESLAAAASATGAPGADLFLEHVHYNLAGHRLMGRWFARHVQTEVLGGAWDESRDLSDEQVDERSGLLPEDGLAGDSLAFQTVQTSPMAEALDNDRLQAALLVRIEEAFRQLPAARREVFAELSLREMQTDLVSHLARAHVARGDLAAGRQLAEAVTRRRPWSADAWVLLGMIDSRAGDSSGAVRAGGQVQRLRPGRESVESSLSATPVP